MSSRRVGIRHSRFRTNCRAFGLAVVLAAMSSTAWARDGYYSYHHSSGHQGSYYQPMFHHLPANEGTPPVSHPSPTPVPEIDAGAAAGGLALLVGMFMLLRDRALAR